MWVAATTCFTPESLDALFHIQILSTSAMGFPHEPTPPWLLAKISSGDEITHSANTGALNSVIEIIMAAFEIVISISSRLDKEHCTPQPWLDKTPELRIAQQ
jgi:hypothetical protein